MGRKSYKQKYEELLNQPDTDKKINKHTKGYIHVGWGSVGRFAALLGSIALAILNFILIISIGNTLRVWEMLSADNPSEAYSSFSQVVILYPLIGEYILIGLVLICFVALVKGGFDKINTYNEGGVLNGVVAGVVAGIIVGGLLVIFGMIVMIGGVIAEVVAGGIGVMVVIAGITGLFFGVGKGLINEFS